MRVAELPVPLLDDLLNVMPSLRQQTRTVGPALVLGVTGLHRVVFPTTLPTDLVGAKGGFPQASHSAATAAKELGSPRRVAEGVPPRSIKLRDRDLLHFELIRSVYLVQRGQRGRSKMRRPGPSEVLSEA